MTKMPQPDEFVIVGVDTHADEHVAVVLSLLGQVLDGRSFPATRSGYARLVEWASNFGVIDRIGVEGTGSWGRGLTLFCLSHGLAVLEVDRPDRKIRRVHGKTDLVDAEAAARAVLAGTAATLPKTADGPVEMIRVLHITRETAVKARTQAINELRSLVVTAPLGLAEELKGLSSRKLITTATCFDIGSPVDDPTAATRLAMRTLARRIDALDDEIGQLEAERDRLVDQTAPKLLELKGVGPPLRRQPADRRRRQPRPAPQRSRLRRNSAAQPPSADQLRRTRPPPAQPRRRPRKPTARCYTIVVSRIRWPDDRTRDYVTRRTTKGEFKPTAKSSAASSATSPARSTQ